MSFSQVEGITMSTGGEMDAFLPLPVTALNQEFMVLGLWNHASQFSTILIIPTEPNIKVEIFR